MENEKFVKEKGFTYKVSKLQILDTEHLCWDCCVAIKDCPKIMDRVKKEISKYEFITDGYQIRSERESERKLIVTGCTNYRNTGPRVFTPEQKNKIREDKKSLKTHFFDSETIEEARVKEESQKRLNKIIKR